MRCEWFQFLFANMDIRKNSQRHLEGKTNDDEVTQARISLLDSGSCRRPLQSLVVGQTQSIPADNTPPPSPPAHHREFLFGPEVSVFFPTSAKTADTYGKTWTSIGVGIGSTIHANMRGAFSPFIDVLYNSHDNNQALLIPLGISYRKSLTNGPIAPFVGIQGFVEPVAQSAPEYHLKYGTSVTGGGRVAAGVQFTKYFYIEAAYLESASVRGYDFSGTQIETGLRF
jgi:hypothetical protein